MNGSMVYLVNELGGAVDWDPSSMDMADYVVQLLLREETPTMQEAPSTTREDASDPAFTGSNALAATHNTVLSSTTASSKSGHAETSIYGALNSFMQAVIAMEMLPLTDGDARQQRSRLLHVTAGGLPSAAKQLLRAVENLNAVLSTLLTDEAVVPARQPPKSARLTCHKFLQDCNAKMKESREALECALDAMNEVEDPDNNSELTVYDACNELYSQILTQRMSIAEAVLASRLALQLRTDQLVHFAYQKLCQVEEDPSLFERMCVEVLPVVQRFLESVSVMHQCFQTAAQLQDSQLPPERIVDVTTHLAQYGGDLVKLGVRDGANWIDDYLIPKYGGRSLMVPFSAAHGSPTGLRRTNSTRAGGGGVSGEAGDQMSDIIEAETLLDRLDEHQDDLNGLYDAIGRVNLWLRRHGLTREVTTDVNTGKVVPVEANAQQVFVPHDVRPPLWSKAMSERYETACVHFTMLKEKDDVAQEFVEVSTLPDDQFILLCHDDMLAALLRKADDACFMGDARAKVERRLASLTMRIKVFYHNNEVRVVSLPQTASFNDLKGVLKQWMPDIMTCRMLFFDESDRVVLDSDAEFSDLVKSARGAAIAAGPMSSLGMSQSLSASATFRVSSKVAGCEIKLDLYVEPPKGGGAVGNKAAASSLPQGFTSEAQRIMERRAQLSREFAKEDTKGGSIVPVVVPASTRTAQPVLQHRGQSEPPPPALAPSRLPVDHGGGSGSFSQAPSSSLRKSTSALSSLRPQFAPPPKVAVPPPPLRDADAAATLPPELRKAAAPAPEPPPPRFQFVHAQPPPPSSAISSPPRGAAPTMNQWSIPDSLSSFGSLAQHTVVGDDGDEVRLSAPTAPQASPVSRAAQLRRLRSAGRQ